VRAYPQGISERSELIPSSPPFEKSKNQRLASLRGGPEANERSEFCFRPFIFLGFEPQNLPAACMMTMNQQGIKTRSEAKGLNPT
jgi:hypothetical protein